MDTYAPRLWSLVSATDDDEKKTNGQAVDVLDAQKKRGDGRAATQMREAFMRLGVTTQSRGSAYIELGGVKIICSIYGPRQTSRLKVSDRGKFTCDVKYAPFATVERRKRGQGDDERALSAFVQQAVELSLHLDKFPKAVLEAYVVILEAGTAQIASLHSTAITCVSLALAHSGVEMYDVVCACNVDAFDHDDEQLLLLDPSQAESKLQSRSASMMVAYMPSLQQVAHIKQSGSLAPKQAKHMVQLAIDGCALLHREMRSCLTAWAQNKGTQDLSELGNAS